jgi:hypothetical protein
MMVNFYKKDDKGKNVLAKSVNLESVPRVKDKVILYRNVFVVREVCYNINKNEVDIQL